MNCLSALGYSVRLTQRTCILKKLERFDMQDCKPCKTPAAVYFKKDAFQREKVYPRRYSKISEYHWISDLCHDQDKTRYSFFLSELWKNVSKPGKNYLVVAKRVLRYVQFSKDYHLEFSRWQLRKSYPCMVIVVLHGNIRNMILQSQVCFQRFDWTSQLVCKKAINYCSIYSWS